MPLDCGDEVACTVTGCDPAEGCTLELVHALCEVDGASCTVDTCDPLHGCVIEVPEGVCSDALPCTVDQCDPGGAGVDEAGCRSTVDLGLCSEDAHECTTHLCLGLQAEGADEHGCVLLADDGVCDDSLGCTTDLCDPGLGCWYVQSEADGSLPVWHWYGNLPCPTAP